MRIDFFSAKRTACLISTGLLVVALAAAGQNQSGDKTENPSSPPVVDAPSASRPNATLPNIPVSPRDTANPEAAPPQAAQPNGKTTVPQAAEVPPGTSPDGAPLPGSARDDLFRLTKNVNFVSVPVTVKDKSGLLVPGLLQKDFTIYEDGKEQKVVFFTSDPFPLSAAIVLDLSMPESDVEQVQKTLPALVGAFSQYDEVGIYTYGNTVRRLQDFTAATGDILQAAMGRLKKEQGRNTGVPVAGGPMGMPGPTVNGRPLDPSLPPSGVTIVPHNSRVLNDAILEAALDLEQRDPTRRKVLFVISDGHEDGSRTSSGEVMKVLLSNQISLYAVAVGSAALPIYGKLDRINIPGGGVPNILPRYTSATGGQVYTELTQASIEDAYARLTREARNQYTIGYTTPATPSSSYRAIEVVVHRPSLKVYAKDGYYPVPARR
jgi:VWFA-related protein